MNHDNINKWVEFLRTTDLPQGQKRLRSEEGYCCLGIGCVVAGIEAVSDFDRHAFGEHRCDSLAPYEFMEWLGISYDPEYSDQEFDLVIDWPEEMTLRVSRYSSSDIQAEYSGVWTLAKLNDSGFTFAQIADVIEYFGIRGGTS